MFGTWAGLGEVVWGLGVVVLGGVLGFGVGQGGFAAWCVGFLGTVCCVGALGFEGGLFGTHNIYIYIYICVCVYTLCTHMYGPHARTHARTNTHIYTHA